MTEYKVQWVQPTPFAGHLVMAEMEVEAPSIEAVKRHARHLFSTVEKRGASGIRVLDVRGNIVFVFMLGVADQRKLESEQPPAR